MGLRGKALACHAEGPSFTSQHHPLKGSGVCETLDRDPEKLLKDRRDNTDPRQVNSLVCSVCTCRWGADNGVGGGIWSKARGVACEAVLGIGGCQKEGKVT